MWPIGERERVEAVAADSQYSCGCSAGTSKGERIARVEVNTPHGIMKAAFSTAAVAMSKGDETHLRFMGELCGYSSENNIFASLIPGGVAKGRV